MLEVNDTYFEEHLQKTDSLFNFIFILSQSQSSKLLLRVAVTFTFAKTNNV